MINETEQSRNIESFLNNCHLKVHDISKNDNDSLFGVYVTDSLINCLTAFIAVCGNGLAFVAMVKTTLQTPSNIFLCFLVASDFLTGLLTQPAYITSHIMAIKGSQFYCITALVAYLLGAFLSSVSFLTLTLINADRYLSFCLPLRYNVLMTNNRARNLVALICFIGAMSVVMSMLADEKLIERVSCFTLFFNLATNIIICCGTLKIIRKQRARIKAEIELSHRLHQESGLARFQGRQKSSMTAMWISLLYFACFTPYFVVSSILVLNKKETMSWNLRTSWYFASTIVLLNACVNPFLYCYRMQNIKLEVQKMLRKILFQSNRVQQGPLI